MLRRWVKKKEKKFTPRGWNWSFNFKGRAKVTSERSKSTRKANARRAKVATLGGVRREGDLNGSSVKVTGSSGNTHMEAINWQLLRTQGTKIAPASHRRRKLRKEGKRGPRRRRRKRGNEWAREMSALPAVGCSGVWRWSFAAKSRQSDSWVRQRTNHTGCKCDTSAIS